MTNYDIEFINTFNEYYPYERLILKKPESINYLFDDLKLTEVFIPSTEIKPILDESGNYIDSTKVSKDEIFVKLIGPAGEIRLWYFDLSGGARETIRNAVVRDFGLYEWECLYVEHEDDDSEDLKEALDTQKFLITEKYGECKVKPNCKIESTLKLCK